MLSVLHKIISRFRCFGYKLRYGDGISFQGYPTCSGNSLFKLLGGRMVIGKSVSFKPGCHLACVDRGVLTIGDHVDFNRSCILVCLDEITVGSNCAFGPNVTVYDHDHNFGETGIQPGYKTAPVIIGNNCWIGAGAIILKGTTIGDGCIIGAGAVVKGNIPPHSMVTCGRDLKIVPVGEALHIG